MKLAIHTSLWGGGCAHPGGITSISNLFYLARDPENQVLPAVAKAGFEGVELHDGNLERYRDDPSQLQRLLEHTNLSLVAVYSGSYFIYADALDDELAKIENVARLAAQFGTLFYVIGGGATRLSGTRTSDYDQLAKALDRAMHIARRYGMEAAYHPHMGSMSQSRDAIYKIMNMTEISLCPDLGHLLAAGADPVEVVSTYRDRIPYLHLKDYGDGAWLPIGDGHVDFKAALAVLAGDKEPAWATVEHDGEAHDAFEMAELLRDRLRDLVPQM